MIFFVQVCIAMVPGGCIMKHPDACRREPEDVPALSFLGQSQQIPVDKNLLQWSFWMHNARGSFNGFTDDANFLRKGVPSNALANVYKEDLSNEVHSFFKQMWTNKSEESQQALVSIFFFGCCLLVII
jgi:hypothetical protein